MGMAFQQIGNYESIGNKKSRHIGGVLDVLKEEEEEAKRTPKEEERGGGRSSAFIG